MKKTLLIILSLGNCTLGAITPQYLKKQQVDPNMASARGILWSQAGIATLTGTQFLLGLAMYLAALNKQLPSPALKTGTVVCGGAALGLLPLFVYTMNRQRKCQAATLRPDILKKKQEYAQGIAQESSEGRKQWEFIKAAFWTSIALGYAGFAMGKGHEMATLVYNGESQKLLNPLLYFLLASTVYAPIAWYINKWQREAMAKAIAEDAVKTDVAPASEKYKTWLSFKSQLWQNVSMGCWVASPLVLPAFAAWFTSKWSRQALIKSIKEDVMVSEKEELTQ